MTDLNERFTSRVTDYFAGRPTYLRMLIDPRLAYVCRVFCGVAKGRPS